MDKESTYISRIHYSLLPPRGLPAAELIASLPSLMPHVSMFSIVRYEQSGISALAELSSHLGHPVSQASLSSIDLSSLDENRKNALSSFLVAHSPGAAPQDITPMELTTISRSLSSSTDTHPVSSFPGLEDNELIGISSPVSSPVSGSKLHIPLIDMDAPIGEESVDIMSSTIKNMDVPAAIVESGRSYHIYILGTLTKDDWSSMMGRMLLLMPLVDVRYIAHRLIDGYGAIRINAS